MITYIYFVKCPNCEDEHFDFFDEAKEYALCCLSKKPIITQTEVCRNDFGECSDSCDLGTIWSWEDAMKNHSEESEESIFSKDDFIDFEDDYNPEDDPEFTELDNSLDNYDGSYIDDLDGAPDNFENPEEELTEWVDSRGNAVTAGGATTSAAKNIPAVNNTPVKAATNNATTLSALASTMGMTDKNVTKQISIAIDSAGKDVYFVDIKAPFSKDKMSYGNSFKFGYLFHPATHLAREIFDKIGVNLKIDLDNNTSEYFIDRVRKIWESIDNKNILLINYPGFHFIIEKDDLIAQLDAQAGTAQDDTDESFIRKSIPEGMTIEELQEAIEENEDIVECSECYGLFEKSSCTHNKEGFGWRCETCSKENSAKDTLVEDSNKPLYIIVDRHGNQLSSPNEDDSELLDRVESMDPYGRRGLRVIAYTGNKNK